MVSPELLIFDQMAESVALYDGQGRFLSEFVRRIPAAALTAYARSEDRAHAIAAGYQLHVTKPVDPTELTQVVASLAGIGNLLG